MRRRSDSQHCAKQLHAYIYAYLDCEKRRRMTITTRTMRSSTTTRCPAGPAGECGLMEHWPVAVSGGGALEVWSQTLSHRGRHGIGCGPQHLGLDAVAATHTSPQRFDSHTERSRIRAESGDSSSGSEACDIKNMLMLIEFLPYP